MEQTKIRKLLAPLYKQLHYTDVGFVHQIKPLLVLGTFDAKHKIPGFYVINEMGELLDNNFSDLLKLAGWCIDEMDIDEKLCCDTDMDSYNIRIFFDPEHWLELYPEIENALKLLKLEDYSLSGFIVTPLDYPS